jgi:phage-related protein
MPISYETFPTDVIGPSYPVERTSEPRVRRVQFGDGYTQETPDGINYKLWSWSLNWDALTEAETTEIDTFLSARNGLETFYWTDPLGTQYKVKCSSWTVSAIEPNIYKLSATFKQVPI